MKPGEFISSLKNKLLNRKKEVISEIKTVEKSDPFLEELKTDGFRNLDEPAEEAADTFQHEVAVAVKDDLIEEKKDIDEALNRIDKGNYGVCEVCGKEISKERLAVLPTATRCIECEKKS